MSLPEKYTLIIVKNSVTGFPVFETGKEDSTFEVVEKDLSVESFQTGDYLIKLLYLSNDPFQRGFIQKPDPSALTARTYREPLAAGDTMFSLAIGEVVYSKNEKFPVGTKVWGSCSWAEYHFANAESTFVPIDTSSGISLPDYYANFGMTTLTAYAGLFDVAEIKEGATVVVSAAAGATGSAVVQLAKHIGKAANVVAIAGSQEGGDRAIALGADKFVNYKSEKFAQELKDAVGKDYADIYFDNVGGVVLDTVLPLLKLKGRVVACGAISGYNDKSQGYVKNWAAIITQKLQVNGFLVSDYMHKAYETTMTLVGAYKSGKLHIDTDIVDLTGTEKRFEQVPLIWSKLFTSGRGNGKSLTKIA